VWLRDWLRVLLLKFVLNVWDGSDEDQQQPQSGVGGEVRAARVGFCVCVCACVCVRMCMKVLAPAHDPEQHATGGCSCMCPASK